MSLSRMSTKELVIHLRQAGCNPRLDGDILLLGKAKIPDHLVPEIFRQSQKLKQFLRHERNGSTLHDTGHTEV